MGREARWPYYDDWRGYGLSKGYYKINPSSLFKSKDKEKRSWYARGNKMKWLMKFKFNRKYILGRWQTYEEWEEYGIEKEYDKRNPMGLRFSKNMEERSWYGKGGTMGKENWLGRFEFERKYGRWENYKEWEEYGVKMKYNERSPSSLLRSEDNEERSWYARGNKMNKKEKWLKKFPFKRKIKQANYWQDWENFKNEMWEAINENNGEVPNYSRMIEIKKGGLQSAINKYHGGKYAILERLGYNEKMREKLARELETIVGEL